MNIQQADRKIENDRDREMVRMGFVDGIERMMTKIKKLYNQHENQ